MPVARIRDFEFREFLVLVAKDGDKFVAVARDSNHKELERVDGASQEEVEAEIKQRLAPLSNDFVSFESAINLFRRAFPDGFDSALFENYEGEYKRQASEFVSEQLSEDELSSLIESEDFDEIAVRAKRAISKTNIPSPYESMRLGDLLKSGDGCRNFATTLFQLLYGDDFDAAFNHFVSVLAKADAAKWPIVTYFLFFRYPDQHMFLKPEITKSCAWRLGYDLDYDPKPNLDTYKSLLGLTDFIRKGISSLQPRDNIDIQSFMYAVASDGYIRDVVKQREAGES